MDLRTARTVGTAYSFMVLQAWQKRLLAGFMMASDKAVDLFADGERIVATRHHAAGREELVIYRGGSFLYTLTVDGVGRNSIFFDGETFITRGNFDVAIPNWMLEVL
ncbi:hypothetical protein P23p72 [Thermus phage P23-45]|uniref:Uncharacterized protein n=1 Tax=Thermus virus P23-45 TaxID=2914006 RepID=A7XXA3_BP234|nr:hypothetical protein P23p72 [Thermus phage P23-45]ABU96905.1 hypothetical protein P23p72 [Thermus phage P23-45]